MSRNEDHVAVLRELRRAAQAFGEHERVAALDYAIAAVEDAERYQKMRTRDPQKDYCLHCGYDGLRLMVGEGLDASVDSAPPQPNQEKANG